MPKAIEAVWKIESTRLIAAIARVTHDIGIAERFCGDLWSRFVVRRDWNFAPRNPGQKRLVQDQLCCNCATTKIRPVLQDCFALTGGPYGEKPKPIFDPFFGSVALAE